MGIALRRLGLSNSAVRSWISLLRLRKDRHTRDLLERFSNCYGMAKQPSTEMDDWSQDRPRRRDDWEKKKKAKKKHNRFDDDDW